MDKLREAVGSLATVVANDPEVLSWSSPTGEWRVGAFEVRSLATRDCPGLLYCIQ